MTKRRFFYTDRLEAEWMGEKFRMRFQGLPEPVYWHEDLIPPRIYIEPDSLHLLEPKVGDFVSFYREYKFDGTSKQHGHLSSIHEDSEYPWTYDDGSAIYASSSKPLAIIQRDGKPFFMPESEAA